LISSRIYDNVSGMNAKSQNKQKKMLVDQNPIESFKGIGQAVWDSAIKDLGENAVSDLWKQLLGEEKSREQNQKFGDLVEGEEVNLGRLQDKKEKKEQAYTEPGIDYKDEIIRAETRIQHENKKALEIKIQEILTELRQIAKSSQEIAIEFKQITSEQRIERPGEYHLNFFQWMLSVVKSARMKIENSSAWISLMKSKKNQRSYWAMFKKHGTTFGLSNERVVATQTG